jgi:hypothetical protein
MHRIEIPDLDYVKEYAGTWEELAEMHGVDAVLYACKLLSYVSEKKLNPLAFKKLVADRLLRRKNNRKKPGISAEDVPLYWQNEAKIAETMNFFFTIKTEKDDKGEESEVYDLGATFTDNLVKELRIKGRKYYGPDGLMANLSLLEFRDCLVCCGEYTKGNKDAADKLASILYRPRKSFYGIRKLMGVIDGNNHREKYNAYKCFTRADRMKSKEGLGFYCFIWFNAVVNYLFTQPVEIDGVQYLFSRVLNGKGKDDEEGAPSENLGFTGVLYALAETNIFGDIEKTGEANILDVFVALYRGYLQNKELEREFKKR